MNYDQAIQYMIDWGGTDCTIRLWGYSVSVDHEITSTQNCKISGHKAGMSKGDRVILKLRKSLILLEIENIDYSDDPRDQFWAQGEILAQWVFGSDAVDYYREDMSIILPPKKDTPISNTSLPRCVRIWVWLTKNLILQERNNEKTQT